jgi:hypothetical protein
LLKVDIFIVLKSEKINRNYYIFKVGMIFAF